MSLIFQLPKILEDSKKEYEAILASGDGKTFSPVEKRDSRGVSAGSVLAHGDNLDFIRQLLRDYDMAGKLQLAYMDPPFYSNASYDAAIKLKSPKVGEVPAIKPMAYDDRWQTGLEDYLKMLCVRLFLIKDMLAEEGCIWVHLDWHVAHYVKILMDEIFGEKNFVNEIIWHYKSGGTGKRNFSRKHDTLLFYGKSKKYYFHPLQEKSYNRGFKPYHFKGVQEFEDELGWYTMVNMKDVWRIDMVGRTSSERTGYATQKPEQLLSRIIESCSRKGDLCADFFSGSGTLAASAEKLGRRWIACDIGGIATAGCLKRLSAQDSCFTVLAQQPDAAGDDLDVEVITEYDDGDGKCLMAVQLRNYRPDMSRIPLQGSDREIIKKFCRKDSLQLLEYWSVDFHYDGKLHDPQFVFTKENHDIEKACREVVRDVIQISIRAVDVFGNSMLKVVEI